MNQGVLYYNVGTSCAVRLLVSVFSLRRHYDGPVTILSEGEDSHRLCSLIADATGTAWLPWDCGVPPGRNRAYLAKTRFHEGTPYQTTIALDSDTVVLGPIDELFAVSRNAEFCVAQLGDWQSGGKTIAARIRQWSSLLPEDMEPALTFGPAINCGVVAFERTAKIFEQWNSLAVAGRRMFIPDEACCQVILHRYPHRVLDGRWNRSCKYDDPRTDDSRIVHFHGRKHCRPGLPFHAEIWTKLFLEVTGRDLAQVKAWLPAGDKMLKRFLGEERRLSRSQRTLQKNAKSLRVIERIRTSVFLKLILGAAKTGQFGWISTDRDNLDVTDPSHWSRLCGERQADGLLAEHVWEHLTEEQGDAALQCCFRFLAPGGRLRLAVPDGNHPDRDCIERVKPGGTRPAAEHPPVLYDYHSLAVKLEAAGFSVRLLEYWDDCGRFHWKDWEWMDGHVSRSFRYDRRNRDGVPHYTSLIIDARKPMPLPH